MKATFRTGDAAMVAAARRVAGDLTRAGFQTLFAGGCVRDALLGRPLTDIDLATAATAEQIEACFPGRTVAVGRAFGVVQVRRASFQFDVATFRTDGDSLDGRHPASVARATPEADARRRDFTINGLFCEPEDGRTLDFVSGIPDIQRRVIRAIGDPGARFREDSLRLLRAVRFAATLEFRLDPDTEKALAAQAPGIARVSAERIASEFLRLLCEAPRPSAGLDCMRETGLLAEILPEVAALHGAPQPPKYHPEGDVWTHVCRMLDDLPPPRSPTLALAVLLHDVGKPGTLAQPAAPDEQLADSIRFPCHAFYGAALAETILRRLRQPSDRVARVKELVADHMRVVDAERMRPARLRRWLGAPAFPELLELMRLDILHSNGDFSAWRFLRDAWTAYRDEPALPEPLVRGRDLLSWGFQPGPALGILLRAIYDEQLEGRVTTREAARAFAEQRRAPPASCGLATSLL